MLAPAGAWPVRVRLLAVAVALCAVAMPAAQEALEPQAAVFSAFPAADGYRTVAREVGHEQRRAIEARLPFPLRFDALGRHSLYVALRGREPIGVLLVRGEEGACGLTEIQWALDLDRRIVGWHCQRVRDRHWQAVRDSEFARRLVGQGVDELRVAVDGDGGLQPEVVGVPVGTEAFCALTVRSALVAIAVVDVVWANELGRLRDLQIAMRSFPGAIAAVRSTAVDDCGNATGPRLVRLLAVSGEHRRALGHVAEMGHGETSWNWVLDPARTVQAVTPAPGIDAGWRARLAVTNGVPLAALGERDDAIGEAARLVQRALPTEER
ncbi:MAG: hypothetical protein IPK26_30600 [Planctomycetes bacterium]|nr:hypothetical protein [Planctomycetota bacterium]